MVKRDEEVIKQILEYVLDKRYCQAILIDGEWGTGKTFFVNHLSLQGKKDGNLGINIEHRLSLFGLYVFVDILLETATELLNVVPAQRQSGCVGVSAEVDEQVAATLDCRVDVEARHAACRTRSEVAVASEHYGRAEVDFGES